MRKLKSILFLGILYVFSLNGYSQIQVSEILQESKIVESESNKLYFVDFWATWCGPCKYSKKILTVLQQQYPRDFHAVSISEENPAKVERFIKKNPTLLTVVVDNEGETFRDYNVKSLPKGILFNAKGEKLWEGHPSDLKPYLLERFLRQNKTRKPFSQFVKLVKTEAAFIKDYEPKSDIEIKHNNIASEDLSIFYINGHVKYEGKLIHILSDLFKINKKQINISDELNTIYTIYINKSLLKSQGADLKVLDKLGLSVSENSKTGEAIILEVRNPKFWDTNQIDWGSNNTKYLVSDTDISGDNVSLKDMAYQLSKALEAPVVVDSNNEKHLYTLHDWQIHYKYNEFMQSNLEEYGIKVKRESAIYPQYIITKKAP